MNKIIEKLGEIGIIPVVAIDDAVQTAPLGKALLDVICLVPKSHLEQLRQLMQSIA